MTTQELIDRVVAEHREEKRLEAAVVAAQQALNAYKTEAETTRSALFSKLVAGSNVGLSSDRQVVFFAGGNRYALRVQEPVK